MTAALAALMLVLTIVAGLSVSLAPTARAALAAFTSSDRTLDLTMDEDGSSVAWVRPALSSKTTRQITAADGPPPRALPLPTAILSVGSESGPSVRGLAPADARAQSHTAASGYLTQRTPTGPPAIPSRAV